MIVMNWSVKLVVISSFSNDLFTSHWFYYKYIILVRFLLKLSLSFLIYEMTIIIINRNEIEEKLVKLLSYTLFQVV